MSEYRIGQDARAGGPAPSAREAGVRRDRSGGMPAEIIVAPGRIDRLFQGFAATGAEARLRSAGGGDTVSARVVGLSGSPASVVVLSLEGEVPAPPLDVRLAGYNSAFVFRVEEARAEAGRLRLAIPERIVRTRSRQHRRVQAPPGATVTFRPPSGAGNPVSGRVVDVSQGGFGFVAPEGAGPFHPGQRLEAKIAWPDGQRQRVEGWVRHRSPSDQGPEQVCGVELQGDLRPWLRLVDRALYPNTRNVSDRRLWELYVESGYLNLSGKSEADFLSLKQDFERANQALVAAADLGCQVLWASPDGGEAALTNLKLFGETWSSYHLCRRQGEPRAPVSARQILREVILHGYEYMQRDPEFRWVVSWVQVTGKFPRHMFRLLTERWCREPELAAIVPFRALEVATDRPLSGIDPAVEVSTPTPDERLRLLAHLASARPWPYVAAHDLTAESLDLRSIRGAWTAAGLHRYRRVQVVRRDGEPVAFSVCDATDEGLHLFGLLDMVHLFSVEPGGESCYPALLEDARAWYRDLGKLRFVFYLEDEWSGFERLGVTDLGFADTLVISADLVPDQLEHVWEATSPRLTPSNSPNPPQDQDQ